MVADTLLRARRALDGYSAVRAHSEVLASPLSPEDQMVQSMPDASPTKWHLAHTSWFFETFLLREYLPGYSPFQPSFEVLYNSYYNSVGEQFPRAHRGLLSRPSQQEVLDYRQHVDAKMLELLDDDTRADRLTIAKLVDLGLHHEQQHQELLLTDIKHALWQNPTRPAYRQEPKVSAVATRTAMPLSFVEFEGGIHEIGHVGDEFHFDNEGPRHRVFLADFALANRPLTNAEVLEFIEAGGYDEPLLWLSDGWNFRQQQGLSHPLYWIARTNGGFDQFSLHGVHPLNPAETASHLSYFEADAIARFFQARLPTETEWEVAARRSSWAAETRAVKPAFSTKCIRPGVAAKCENSELSQLQSGVWEWTQSPYTAYPGFQASKGAVGEYNGKFMHNQMVLRGGSCATSKNHARVSYRNFFPSHAQWQFSGVRLARGAGS